MSLPNERMGVEQQLLVCCARICMDSAHAERIRLLLQQTINWPFLLQIAHYHGVMPLLYRSLQATCPEEIPPATLDKLRDSFRTNLVRNEILARELLTLLDLFRAQGISAIPFKGPTLATSAYGHLSLRQFGDLDLFVPKCDLLRACEVLVSQGYRVNDQVHHRPGGDLLRAKYHPFVGQDGLVRVDVQWMIADSQFSFHLDHEDWRASLVPISMTGMSIFIFSPEVVLLILCVHGSKHLWTKLQWLCDVAELLRAYPKLDWERVNAYARRFGSQRMLAVAGLFAHDLLGTTLSTDVLERMKQDKVAQLLVGQLRSQLFMAGDTIPGAVEPSFFYLQMRERWRNQARYVFRLCVARDPIITGRASRSLPVSLTFLYYLLWPILLIGKYGLRSQKLKITISQWLERMG
ncbi:MAG: nucleotidyltransferase family protein [Nitrospirales bacterium]|nr:nucleotidyltransferase family protein [Nitrospira sp.]MDR4483603.1 nucleotidyltransferase family protein [Nitrospirales bacterium]